MTTPPENPLTPVKFACSTCGKDSYGRRFEEEPKKRHRRFYQGEAGPICGCCVKKEGGRCGK